MTLLTIFYTALFYFATGVFVIGLAAEDPQLCPDTRRR
jgi:hypothetical protein